MILEQINLKNKELKGYLSEIEKLIPEMIKETDFEGFEKSNKPLQDHLSHRQESLSEDYVTKLISTGSGHFGYPDYGYMHALTQGTAEGSESPIHAKFHTQMNALNSKILYFLGAYNEGLFSIYPPGGFIGWHNNANAHGLNLIITWSENGSGHFKYKDDQGETQYIYDKPGWQAKMAYFAPYYHEEYQPLYHAAETDCWRFTCAYRFADQGGSGSKELWEELKADLEVD